LSNGNKDNANRNKGNIVSENGNLTLNITDIENGRGDSHGEVGGGASSTNQSNAESGLISEGIDVQHLRMFNGFGL